MIVTSFTQFSESQKKTSAILQEKDVVPNLQMVVPGGGNVQFEVCKKLRKWKKLFSKSAW